jgi:hypothetical protein
MNRKNAWILSICVVGTALAFFVWRTARTHAAKIVDNPAAPAQVAQPTGLPAPASTPSSAQPLAQSVSPAAPVATSAALEQRLGPFPVAGKEYTAIMRKQLPAGAKPGEGETVVSMEIRDVAGASQYARAFPNVTQTEGFVDAFSVFVNLLSGAHSSGLLVSYDQYSEPSAPEIESSGWWQVFGVVDAKLRAFSGPILLQGDLLSIDPNAKAVSPPPPFSAPDDILRFKVWAGRYRLMFPVRIDWIQGKLVPAQACNIASDGHVEACEYKVLPENERQIQDLTFVRLCPAAGIACKNPERVVVKKDSKVELVAASAEMQWNPGKPTGPSGDPKNSMDDAGAIAVLSKEPWLKVRIDGKEGWIHSQEDFDALGMPQDQ